MILDVDFLIDFFKKHSSKDDKNEFNEQDAPTTPSGGGGKAVPKWSDVHGGPKRGKANMLGRGGEKWDSAINRGVANQIW
jgi:hypothetical protein